MWGGKGHPVIHLLNADHPEVCLEVKSHHLETADASDKAKANHWAKKHGATVHDGPCAKKFKDEVKHFSKDGVHVKIFMV